MELISDLTDGTLVEMKPYRNGKLEGEYKAWNGNRHLLVRAFYRDGKLSGECKRWESTDENKSLKLRRFYRDGVLIISFFSIEKKLKLLRIKKHLQNCILCDINHWVIRDLSGLF